MSWAEGEGGGGGMGWWPRPLGPGSVPPHGPELLTRARRDQGRHSGGEAVVRTNMVRSISVYYRVSSDVFLVFFMFCNFSRVRPWGIGLVTPSKLPRLTLITPLRLNTAAAPDTPDRLSPL